MTMISISDLTFAYEGSSDNVFEHVSFHMDTEWRLGFTGRNGRGKTTFLRLLLESGKAPGKRALEYTGTIRSLRKKSCQAVRSRARSGGFSGNCRFWK